MKEKPILKQALELAETTLQFGYINRVTCHPTGVPESDTDHTVMLSIMACAFAAKFQPDLNLGLISQFAMVHDFVEVYAGDTDTASKRTEKDKQEKKTKEAKALAKLKERFASLPWIVNTIEKYDSLDTPEARYIKVFDKVLPKLTHILNDCFVVKSGYDLVSSDQRKLVMELAKDWDWLIDLWEQSVEAVLNIKLNSSKDKRIWNTVRRATLEVESWPEWKRKAGGL